MSNVNIFYLSLVVAAMLAFALTLGYCSRADARARKQGQC